QAIEGQKARKQCAKPEYRGPQPGQQGKAGPDGERHEHHDGEKKQHADQGPAPDAERDPDVPANEGAERAHEASPMRSVRVVVPRGVWVAATITPPRAR